MSQEFQIGDIIQTIGFATYDNIVPIGTLGEIIHIRHRYRNIHRYMTINIYIVICIQHRIMVILHRT